MRWAAEAVAEWVDDVRPAHGKVAGPMLWPTERGERISPDQINARFAAYRDALGFDAGLRGPHCLRHAYITHLLEDGWDHLFVQQQVGHAWGSTTAVYTAVSSEFRNRTLRRALDRAAPTTRRDEMARAKLGYRWHLRVLMAQRNMFATTDLAPRLAERGIELSAAQVYRLVAQTPERLSLRTLVALCDILDCTPNDLVEPVAAPARARATGTVGASAVKARQPRRADITGLS